ncbi:signal peptide containing protein [Theileria equi strain WA]|uniref:Signal peptide containing protein n=1 Tax=Theileria equi strain WA TaxID=1537102 RepID=L1L9T1_THEEQ|nr:signal peptide containing protein [Theileria equi strain WA]EKX72004.1 signal peptide containing protein [Theileria equi strain WA]|eukprot:XP_004831456.1 signal peptide containing protein [Theileria equi strain WA]
MKTLILAPFLLSLGQTIVGSMDVPRMGKILLDLDISGGKQNYITVSMSKNFQNGINYSINKSVSHQFALGNILDNGELVFPGDPTVMNRHVLLVPREDGTNYLRIITRYKEHGSYRTSIHEFVRTPSDLHYNQISRNPFDIDILNHDSDEFVSAEILVNWQKHNEGVANGRATMDTPEDLETMPMKFTIQKNMQDKLFIGRVFFNGKIVDDKTDGLLSRDVTWEGGLDMPRIIILSRYNDGTRLLIRYDVISGEFIVKGINKLPTYEAMT